MKLEALEGQARAVALLQSALRGGRVHHAWLFAGPDGVGKETAARALAAALICPRAEAGDGCGGCDVCRRIERGVHPDVLLVTTEAEAIARKRLAREDLSGAPSRELKVEQLRRLEAALAVPPLEGPRRVVIVADADAMNPAAQNAFLKTLEEPPLGTVIVLVAASADALLPTIRSRCVRVPFAPLPLDAVRRRLARDSGLDDATARRVAALSGGSLGQALALDAASLQGRAEFLAAVEGLRPDDLRPALRLAEAAAARGREGVEADLAVLALFYRDVAATASGAGDDALLDAGSPEVLRAAAARGPEDALRRARLVARARQSLDRNGAARLVLERLLLSLVVPAEAA